MRFHPCVKFALIFPEILPINSFWIKEYYYYHHHHYYYVPEILSINSLWILGSPQSTNMAYKIWVPEILPINSFCIRESTKYKNGISILGSWDIPHSTAFVLGSPQSEIKRIKNAKIKYMLQWSKIFSGFGTSKSCHQLPLSTFCQIVPRNSLEPRSRHLLIESESQIFWSILREIWSQSEPSRDCLDLHTEMQELVTWKTS